MNYNSIYVLPAYRYITIVHLILNNLPELCSKKLFLEIKKMIHGEYIYLQKKFYIQKISMKLRQS